jgi:Ca2+-binding RTX toxin-like protein
LYGQDGDDALYGGNDNDTLLGEAGADHLTGGAGSDTQHGGAGNDSYFWNPGGGDDVIQDDTGYAERYAISRLIFGPGVLPADVTTETVPGSSTHIKFQVRASGVPAGSVQVNQWNTLHSYSSIRHGSTWSIEFADGTVWNGAVLATPLADTIAGTAGTDQISGGAGNDILSGMDGDDSLAGDEGDDILYAGSGNDILNGGLDNDTLLGEEGADQITGGAGNDTQHGGAGDDVYFWNPGDGDDVIQEDTGYSERYATSRLIFGPGVLPADVTTETVPGSSTHLRFQIRASGVPVGSVQVNQWNALHSYTSIRHCGTWHIEFANGTVWNGATLATPMADTLTGTPGADQMSGGGGNDILSGMDGDDTLAGDAGDDILYGGNDNDTLQGGADADTLFGEAGNDSFLGGDSNDTLFGGPGSDTYFWNPGDGDDTIQDDTWYSETSAINRLVFGLGVLPSDVVLETVPGSSTHIRFQVRTSGIPSGSVLVNQWNTLHSYTSIRHNSTWRIEFADGTVWNGAALGTPFADTLVGTPGADQMSGGAGNDSLSGMDGDDSLAGDAGDDNLDGGSGNDTLVGGTGDDMLNGGEGADIYASSAEFV